MLVLTRMISEEIRIGHDVIVRVLDIKGDRVRIGIEAPSEIPVHRQEVYAEIERANREAMEVASAGLEGAQKLLKQEKKEKKEKKDKKEKKGAKAGDGTARTRHKEGAARAQREPKSMEVNHGT